MMQDIDLKEILLSWFISKERRGEKFGFQGKVVSGSYEVETGDGRVWVTLDEGTVVKAINRRVARKPGIRVIVKPNRDGDLEIVGLQSSQMTSSVGNNGAAAAILETPPHQHFIGSGNEDPVESRRFMPGLVHAYSGLTVYIEPFLYEYNGTEARWPGGTKDLTSNRPSTSAYYAWVKVGVNPATNTAVATTGAEFPLRTLLALSDLDAINFDASGYIPCGGVILKQGQTASPIETDFAEARDVVTKFDPARPPALGGTTPAAGTFTDVTANRYALTAATTLTIAAGVVTATKGYHLIDAESGSADDLDTINGGLTRSDLTIQAASGDTITVKHGTGNIFLNGAADFALSGDKTLRLFYDGTNWSDLGAGGGGSSPWQTTSNVTNLVTSTDTVTIGSSANLAKLAIVGDADEIQFRVRAHSTQGNNLSLWETFAGAARLAVSDTFDLIPAQDDARRVGTASLRMSQVWSTSLLGERVATRVKNTSGATANANHVGYITYTAGSGAEYKTTTTANFEASWCIVIVGGANNADIYVARTGVVTVELNANCSAGDFLTTSSTAGRAAVNTLMRPEVFAIALTANAGGAGGTCTARLYCNTKVVSVTNANFVWKVAASNSTQFVATINGTPSGTSVVYNAPSAGNENCIVPSSANDLLKMRIWNTTRSSYALISTVNTGTNTITLTDTVPGAWASGDTITIESQTMVTGTAFKLVEADFVKAIANGVFPSTIRHIICSMTVVDTGAAGYQGFMHPYESYAASKLFSGITVGASLFFVSGVPPFPVISGVIGVGMTASGTGTQTVYLNLYGFTEATP